MYRIELINDNGELCGCVSGTSSTFTKEDADRLVADMEGIFLDADGTPLEMKVVEADEDRLD